jgi:hypothetical protein
MMPPLNGNSYTFKISTGAVTNLLTGNTGFGIKDSSNNRLLELKNSGDLLISGRYTTTQGTFTTLAGQSFDGFDYAEIYECDKSYPSGTVVCPGPANKMTLCTHDNCPYGAFVSYQPGFQIGQEQHEQGVHPIALVGRINARTAYAIPMRTPVCSDGRGGVRPLKKDEWGYMLGFTLNETVNGTVGIFIRPMFARG